MKKIILMSLAVMLVGCSSYNIKNEALTSNEYDNISEYCRNDNNGSVIWKNNVAYCDNGSRQYLLSKTIYKDSSPAWFH